MTNEIFVLLMAFQVKHLLADYYWQVAYMYENKGAKTGWIEPLMMHAGVHAATTLVVLGGFFMWNGVVHTAEHKFILMLAVLFDFVTHFWIDRLKATRKSKIDESQFWVNLGLDQFAHHVVGILIVLAVARLV
jgi:hypothetical protein